AVTLSPNGLGARQLHLLYTELGLTDLGAMLVHGLRTDDRLVGLLLLARSAPQDSWEPETIAAITPFADYVARAIDNSQSFQTTATAAAAAAAATAAQAAADTAVSPLPPPEPADSGRILALETERSRLAAELETAVARARQAEARAAEARKQAQDLAAAMQEMEQLSQDDRVVALQAEIEALRESLTAAEETLALAAAGDSNLSTEWVMLTITRYSSQLEEAQARIESLEDSLQQHETQRENRLLTGLAQELRTPMTSIAGYTDLLLGETIGILGAKQREFLQRIKANSERMGTLLDQIIQLTAGIGDSQPQAHGEANLADVVEAAAHAVITQIREKRLRLDLNIERDLPHLPVREETLRQILVYLLDNACRASAANGRIAVTAQAKSVTTPNGSGQAELVDFVHIMVQDSGSGISAEDRPHVFDPHYQASHPLITGLGDTGAALAVARSLTLAHGGRIWVDGQPGVGSTFSVLFPLAADAAGAPAAPNGQA
ncbi:MAG: hypothetical protein KC425_02805, partial [Anaerolineales bacterium]|nr:hypothetical protein [Anaerolineales bacterium]